MHHFKSHFPELELADCAFESQCFC